MKKSPRILFKEQVRKDLATKDEQKIMQYFNLCIPFEQIDYFFNHYLTKKDKERFNKFMYGRTCPLGGYYYWDVVHFFRGGKSFD